MILPPLAKAASTSPTLRTTLPGWREVIPFDLQTLASLERGPGFVGDDGASAERLKHVGRLGGIDGQRLFYARNLQRSFVVIRLDFLTEDWRMFDGGENHSGHGRVHAEDCLTGHHVGEIEQGIVFSDVPPFRARLELKILCFRDRKFCGG